MENEDPSNHLAVPPKLAILMICVGLGAVAGAVYSSFFLPGWNTYPFGAAAGAILGAMISPVAMADENPEVGKRIIYTFFLALPLCAGLATLHNIIYVLVAIIGAMLIYMFSPRSFQDSRCIVRVIATTILILGISTALWVFNDQITRYRYVQREKLIEMLQSKDEKTVAIAIREFRRRGGGFDLGLLVRDPHAIVRYHAAVNLRDYPSRSSKDTLQGLIKDADPNVHKSAALSFLSMTGKPDMAMIHKLEQDADNEISAQATLASKRAGLAQ